MLSSGSNNYGSTTSSFTIEAWIKPVTFDAPIRIIFEKMNGATSYLQFYMANSNIFYVSINSQIKAFNSVGWTSATEDNKWHYVSLSIRQSSTTGT